MSRHKTHAALRLHLTQWPERPNIIVWQGKVSSRPSVSFRERWVRETFRSGPTGVQTIGPTPTLRTEGVYLLDVFVPSVDGMGPAEEWADELLAHFCPRTELVYQGQVVHILAASTLGDVSSDPGWHQLPCSVTWRTDSINPK